MYHTDEQSQGDHIAKALCDMLEHFTSIEDVTAWPSNVLDVLLVLTLALKKLNQAAGTRKETPALQVVIQEMQGIFSEAQKGLTLTQPSRRMNRLV